MENFVIEYSDEQEMKKKQMYIRNEAFRGMFKYDNGTDSIVHKKQEEPKEGSFIYDFKGVLRRVTKVLETRDHKGIYVSELNREKISIVESIPVQFIASLN